MKTLLVTGANRGIGLALCAQAASRGMHVIGTCRQSSPELAAIAVEIIDAIDVTAGHAIDRLAKRLDGRPIDILINNAGITARETFATFDRDAVRRQFDVNALGPLSVTHALAANLPAGAKVVILGSRAGALAAVANGGRYAYRMSKAAAHMAGAILAHDLSDRGIGVYVLYPGYVATRMMNWEGIDPCVSACQILDRIESLSMQESGMFLDVRGERLSW